MGEEGSVVTSTIAYAEVVRGIPAPDEHKYQAVARFFDLVPPLPFDRAAAEACARLPFGRASHDRLIAAHAMALGLTLVTANVCDFAKLDGLAVEDWTRPA